MSYVPQLTHAQRRERRERMAERVRNGEAPNDVADSEKVSLKTVQKACQVARVNYLTTPAYVRPAPSQLKILGLLFDRSLSVDQIVEITGLSKHRIQQVRCEAVKAGIPVPSRKGNRQEDQGSEDALSA